MVWLEIWLAGAARIFLWGPNITLPVGKTLWKLDSHRLLFVVITSLSAGQQHTSGQGPFPARDNDIVPLEDSESEA